MRCNALGAGWHSPLISRVGIANQPHTPHLGRIQGRRARTHPPLGIEIALEVTLEAHQEPMAEALEVLIATSAPSPLPKAAQSRRAATGQKIGQILAARGESIGLPNQRQEALELG